MNQMEQQFNIALKGELLKHNIKFPTNSTWAKYASIALRTSCPHSLGISAKEYGDLYYYIQNHSQLNCYDFAVINNNLEIKSPKDLMISDMIEYVNLMLLVEEYSAKWNEQTTSCRDTVLEIFKPKIEGNGLKIVR